MELSGLIFVALALVWAAVLIPMALRQHDEVAQTRNVDDVSESGRVLHRHGPAQAAPTVDSAPIPAPRRSRPESAPAAASASVPTSRAAARRAARRRRRVLAALLLVAVGTAAAAWYGVLPAWSPAVPGTLVLAFLLVARLTVRRELRRRQAQRAARRTALEAAMVEPAAAPPVAPATLPVIPAQAAGPRAQPATPDLAVPEEAFEVVSGLELTAAIPLGVLSGLEPTLSADGLWDPLPMTLPTYVSKPRAARSVRTIDLASPGVSNSGRDAADSALVAEAATAPPADEQPASRRAVGS